MAAVHVRRIPVRHGETGHQRVAVGRVRVRRCLAVVEQDAVAAAELALGLLLPRLMRLLRDRVLARHPRVRGLHPRPADLREVPADRRGELQPPLEATHDSV